MHLWARKSSMQTEQLSVWGTKAEQRARVGRPQTSEAPSNFIAGRPMATLLFWFFGLNIQSTLVISKSKGPSETLRDIRISTYQIWRIEKIPLKQPNFTNEHEFDSFS